MKNIEKNQLELAKLIVNNYKFAVSKKGNIGLCTDIHCINCIFNRGPKCSDQEEWAYSEHKESVLDDVEREYLSAVIKPFRDSVKYITKMRNRDGFDSLKIELADENIPYKNCDFWLPPFIEGSMYKKMEPNKDYSVEDLGL